MPGWKLAALTMPVTMGVNVVTVNRTVTVRSASPGLATATVPVWFPAPKPVGFTVTDTEAGVFPDAGEIWIHPAVTDAVQFSTLSLLLVTWIVCAAGIGAPRDQVN
jgi:hypothetical protein